MITTIKQQIYEIIKTRIADGTYSHGQRLQEKDLAAELKVSRSPVREVLKQLVMEGLLIDVPNKGVSLKVFTEKEIHDIYHFRILIETSIVDMIAKNPSILPTEELEKARNILLSPYDEKDYVTKSAINPHDIYADAIDNEYTTKMYHQASMYTMSYHSDLFEGDNYETNIREHLEMLERLLAHDYKGAKKAITSHLLNSEIIICNAIKNKSI